VWFMIKDEFTLERINHWNSIAELPDSNRNWGNAYHKRIQKLFKSIIPSGHSIVEIGCGKGNLLAFLHPLQGLGVDFSPKMILSAREKYPELNFQIQDAHELKLDQKFDYVIMSDLVNDLWNVQQVLSKINNICHDQTRLVINFYSRLWQPILAVAAKLGLSRPVLQQNWLTIHDIDNLLNLAGFQRIQHHREILCPIPIPVLQPFFDKFLVKFWPFNHLALTNIIIARSVNTKKKN